MKDRARESHSPMLIDKKGKTILQIDFLMSAIQFNFAKTVFPSFGRVNKKGKRSFFMNNQMTVGSFLNFGMENAKRHCLKFMFQAVPLGKFTITQGGRKWNNQK